MPQAFTERFCLLDIVHLFLIYRVKGLAEHVIDDAFLSFFLHNLDLLLRETLVV